jgi:predicted RNA-binding protein with RPS1 domain
MELLAFQSGSIVQVRVSRVDADNGMSVTLRAGTSIQEREGSIKPSSTVERVQLRSVDDRKMGSQKRSPRPLKSSLPPGILLSNLKTGMAFDSKVTNVTPFAAFVDLNVFRKAKGISSKNFTFILRI